MGQVLPKFPSSCSFLWFLKCSYLSTSIGSVSHMYQVLFYGLKIRGQTRRHSSYFPQSLQACDSCDGRRCIEAGKQAISLDVFSFCYRKPKIKANLFIIYKSSMAWRGGEEGQVICRIIALWRVLWPHQSGEQGSLAEASDLVIPSCGGEGCDVHCRIFGCSYYLHPQNINNAFPLWYPKLCRYCWVSLQRWPDVVETQW